MKYGLSYQDIVLIPKFSYLETRSAAKTNISFGGKKFKLPIQPANMVCCIDNKLASWLSENEYFYTMHRFNGKVNKKDLKWFIKKANEEKWKNVSISIGVQTEDIELIRWVAESHLMIDFLTIDIAHGHSINTKSMLKLIHQTFKTFRPFIIAGNIGTPEAVQDLESWGADATKIGLAYGRACITKNKTGFATPMFSTILECSKVATKPIIADGSISENGDIAKALVAGATMVMAGSMFAACKDSPAENIYASKIENLVYLKDDGLFPKNSVTGYRCIEDKEIILEKKYFGSASEHNGNIKNIEGKEVIIPCNGMTYIEKFNEIKSDLQSAISYAGGKDLEAFKMVDYQIVK